MSLLARIHTCMYNFIVAKLIEYLAIISPSGLEVILLFPPRKLINPALANDFTSVIHKSGKFKNTPYRTILDAIICDTHNMCVVYVHCTRIQIHV